MRTYEKTKLKDAMAQLKTVIDQKKKDIFEEVRELYLVTLGAMYIDISRELEKEGLHERAEYYKATGEKYLDAGANILQCIEKIKD